MEQDWKYWAQKWEISGQSQKQFCLDKGLRYSQFKNWRQRAIREGLSERQWSDPLSDRMSFSELAVQTSDSASNEIVLELPHGITLRIPSNVGRS